MAQIGCPSLDQLGPEFLHWDPEDTGTQHPPLRAAAGRPKRRLELRQAMRGERAG